MTPAYSLFLRAAALGDGADLRVALRTWGAFCDAAHEEIAAPMALTDVAGLASMAATAHLRCGDYHELLGDLEAAEAERTQAKALSATHGDGAAQVEVRRTLANSLKTQARFGEAMAEFAALETAYDPTEEPVNHARVLVDHANLLEWLGDFERAEKLLARAEHHVADRLQSVPEAQGKVASILGALADMATGAGTVQLQSLRMEIGANRGHLAKRSGRFDDARAHFLSVRDDHVAWGVGPAIDFHLMHLDALTGRNQAAIARLNGLDAAMRDDARMLAKLPVLHWVGALAVLDQDPGWALERVEAGIPTLEHVGDHEALWKLYRTAADAHRALDQPDAATARYLDAARTVDQLRRMPLGYRLESTYFADRLPMFNDAVHHAAAVDHGEAALELTELAKSRSLATLVYGARRSLDPTDPSVARVEELGRAIDALDYAGYAGETSDPAKRAALVQQRAAQIEQIRVADPRWRSLTEPAPISLGAIRNSLDGAIAISLFCDHDAVVAVAVEADDITVARTELSKDTRRELDDYCDNVRRAEDPYAYDLSGFGEVGLRDLLPDSVCDRLLAHDRAVIVPHGRLHLVPWSSLFIESSSEVRLFEHVAVATMPNLMCLPAIAGAWSGAPRTHIVGAPDYETSTGLAAVDAAGEEFDALCAIWNGTATGSLTASATGSEVNESLLRAAFGSEAELLHVSCHGIIDHVEPSSSALLASDGKVDAAEIALGGSCPDEVVLAACSTGYRPDSVDGLALTGDDVVGLPAALLEAGARGIVMSIPKAHDATSVQFMVHYHRARAEGAAPIDAYRKTQVDMLAIADPSLWCGYVFYGSPSVHIQPAEAA